MRKVTFGVANSLDNYIAREDGGIDWLRGGDDVTKLMEDYWKTIDTVIMGRKTFEAGEAAGGGYYEGVHTYVFSRTKRPAPYENVTYVTQDPVDFLRELKRQKGKDICCMGGGEIAKLLLEAGLIDEVSVNIHPVLLGSGIPLFLELSKQIDLDLVECLPLEEDCVILTYRVAK